MIPLYTDRFKSNLELRQCRNDAIDYLENAMLGDLHPATNEGEKYLAAILDQSARKAYQKFATILQNSKEHEDRVKEINSQPRLSSKDKVNILEDSSSFEQMSALASWVSAKKIKKVHTFRFATVDDYIPVRVNESNLMQVVLGDSQGAHKAPKYSEWAINDPRENDNQKIFIHPLESLEIVRQPHYNAATLLKGNAYENYLIENDWRYDVNERACVESSGQSKNSPMKKKSAGHNLVHLTASLHDPSEEDLLPVEDLCPIIDSNDYTDEGPEEDYPEVRVDQLIKATKKAIVNRDRTDLNDLMFNLTVAKIGPVATQALKNEIKNILWGE